MHWPIRRRRKQQGTQAARPHAGQPSLPSGPLRPTIEPSQVDARQRAFVRGLTTRARIQVARTGLAHRAEGDAPPGRVDRLIVPVPARGESRLERLRERTLDLLRPGRGRPQAPPVPPVLVLRAIPAEAESPRPEPGETLPTRGPAQQSGPAPSPGGPRAERATVRDREAEPPPAGKQRPTYLRLLQWRSPPSRTDETPGPPAPSAVRAPVEQHFGVDLARVEVHRGPESTAAARRLRARAFTALGHVHVPSEAGPLTSGPAKALLAHELVHAAQQHRGPVPAEGSSQGRVLEEEARHFERAAARDVRPGTAVVLPAVDGSIGRDQAPASPVPDALAVVAPVLVSRSADGLAAAPGVQRAGEAGAAPTAPEPSLDEVVNRLYDQFSSRLRAELLVDRERAGSLNDR